jgi:hypothetical protein
VVVLLALFPVRLAAPFSGFFPARIALFAFLVLRAVLFVGFDLLLPIGLLWQKFDKKIHALPGNLLYDSTVTHIKASLHLLS